MNTIDKNSICTNKDCKDIKKGYLDFIKVFIKMELNKQIKMGMQILFKIHFRRKNLTKERSNTWKRKNAKMEIKKGRIN